MKLLTWNCNGAFRKKAAAILTSQPDLAVIQECENLSKLGQIKDFPVPTEQHWNGVNPSRGVGIFSYGEYRFSLYKNYDADIQYCIPIQVIGPQSFHLIAIWAMPHSDRQQSYIGQVYKAVGTYADFIRQADTVILGDLNSNQIFDKKFRIGNHTTVVNMLAEMGLVSAYHDYYQEQQGSETRPTFYLYRHQAKPLHLDYIFIPKNWMNKLSSIEVGDYDRWREYSDHCPVTLEIQ
ncbi:MAG: hypothetical protein P4L50_29970 [Anaerolineaceae bacterium]|nr:hypothetical protein [Anaerolineaceae bacterium]